MSTNTTTKSITISPAAPYAGLAGIILGSILFGLGLGWVAPLPIIFGMIMLFLGLFIVVGLFRPYTYATHRKR